MKHLLMSFLLLPALAQAEPLALNFKAAKVMDFAEATYKAILNKDYVISPELMDMDKRVTISIKQIERSKLPQLLGDVLASVGVTAREVGGIVRLERDQATDSGAAQVQPTRQVAAAVPSSAQGLGGRPPEPEEFEIYRPKNRTVEYLQALLRAAGLQVGIPGGGQGQQTTQDAMVIAGSEE
ncbi:MAG TPA: hypothetical protein VFF03_09470, partial [Rhodocyclaceae bacterium]|nr:hypothetical protein [Rhodocyclaceae bacterium]